MNQVHQWLVKQGRLGISASDRFVSIDVDPQGAPDCLLTLQDAEEVAAIVALHARAIWEGSDPSAPYEQSYEEHGEMGYRWTTAGGSLTIQRIDGQPEVRLRYAGTQPCLLTVGQAVELIQLLQLLVQVQVAPDTAPPSPSAPPPPASPPPSPPPPPPAPQPAEPEPVAKKPWWKFW